VKEAGAVKGFFVKLPVVDNSRNQIPSYDLEHFRHVHRAEIEFPAEFGCNSLPANRYVPGFQLYSSWGLVHSVGPLRSEFYRISFTVSGTLNMQIGLESFQHLPRTVAVTYPNQIFSKQVAADTFGYYLLFTAGFLESLLPASKLSLEFPFLGAASVPVFQLTESELTACIKLIREMDAEIRGDRDGRARALQLYLHLLLLEIHRGYLRQGFDRHTLIPPENVLVSRFHQLVDTHFLKYRRVTDYAALLAVSADHLNKVVKEITGITAAQSIRKMLAQEAKLLLLNTESTVAEIAYQLEYIDPAAFNRFFTRETGETPMSYRTRRRS
jgi:AraC-like DNA-binding protein